MGKKKECSCGFWNQAQQECLHSGCIHDEKKKPIVTMGFVEMLRDRLMAIPIREYYISNRRKVIADKLKETFIRHGVEVVEK